MSETDSQDSQQSTESKKWEIQVNCKLCDKIVDRDEIESGKVINPCNCQGWYAFVHTSCMNKRLEMNKHLSCDICRFTYNMTRETKSFREWMNTWPRKEEFTEAGVRTVNVANIIVIGWITMDYSAIPINVWLKYPFNFMSIVRIMILTKLWVELFVRLYKDYTLWKADNFHVFVKQNEYFKLKIEYQRDRSPARVSTPFSKRTSSASSDSSASTSSQDKSPQKSTDTTKEPS